MGHSNHAKVPTIEPLRPELARLAELEDDWDSNGAPAPNETALALAERALSTLRAAAMTPERIIASSEGGVALVFVRGRKVADIEALNSGELLASTIDYASGESKVWELPDASGDVLAAVETFRTFLGE